MKNNNIPWVMKYAPKEISKMLLNPDLNKMFLGMVQSGNLSNLLISGIQGTGKTTIAKLIPQEFGYYMHFQSCSSDGSIDMIKTTVQNYCQMITEPGKLKVVILDEADQLSIPAQMALRNIIIDNMDTTRFILTCNYIDKIIPAIQSRCTPVKIEFSIKECAKYMVDILNRENIKTTKAEFNIFIENVIKKQFPDIRSIIERLQLCSQGGSLKLVNAFSDTVENQAVEFIMSSNDPIAIRTFLLNNEDLFSGDYVKLAGALFNRVNNTKHMLIIADAIYKMSLVIDKEIQFAAMIILLKGEK